MREFSVSESISFFLLIILTISGCTSESDLKFEPLYFRVDQALLDQGHTTRLAGLCFQPPKNWQPAEDATVQQIQNQLDQSNDTDIKYQIFTMFIDSAKQNIFTVGRLKINNQITSLKHYHTIIHESINHKFSGNKIAEGMFSVNEISTIQYRIIAPDKINYKLFLFPADTTIIQLDYTIAQPISGRITETIESSIGSIGRTE